MTFKTDGKICTQDQKITNAPSHILWIYEGLYGVEKVLSMTARLRSKPGLRRQEGRDAFRAESQDRGCFSNR